MKEEFGIKYVLIRNEIQVVRYIEDDVMVMYLGEVVEYGQSEDVLKNKKNEYKKKIFDEKKSEDVNDIRERVEESDEERKEVIR